MMLGILAAAFEPSISIGYFNSPNSGDFIIIFVFVFPTINELNDTSTVTSLSEGILIDSGDIDKYSFSRIICSFGITTSTLNGLFIVNEAVAISLISPINSIVDNAYA